MALNIDLVNGGINVYETGEVPRTYFGAVGASGKFYPSGSVDGSVIDNNVGGLSGLQGFRIISNTLADLVDDNYIVPSENISGSGSPNLIWQVAVQDGQIPQSGLIINQINTYGYNIGDRIEIQGSELGGSGSIIFEVTQLKIDSFLIVIGGDDYQVKWSDLLINGTSPTSLQNAQELLAALFSGLGKSYKVYTALLNADTQSVIVLENTLGEDITWSFDNTYTINGYTNNPVFTENKTIGFCYGGGDGEDGYLGFLVKAPGDTNINLYDPSGNIYPSIIIRLEIRVYN